MYPLLAVILALLLFGCADVQERSHIVGGRTGAQLTASVGDTVLRVSRDKNLPNIVGKSDIFGRTTPTGVEADDECRDWRYNDAFRHRDVRQQSKQLSASSAAL